MSTIQPSQVRTYAVLSSVVMVLCSPMLAMSYFATEDGAESYAVGSVHAWAEPGRRLLEPLLTFASADRVYATYSLLVALVIPALPLAVWTVRRARAPLCRDVRETRLLGRRGRVEPVLGGAVGGRTRHAG